VKRKEGARRERGVDIEGVFDYFFRSPICYQIEGFFSSKMPLVQVDSKFSI
jgi:hypothetical protein